jgi:hypothetical protein
VDWHDVKPYHGGSTIADTTTDHIAETGTAII